MASPHQKRVLLGLQAGLTLREVLREPHMPNERMLAEWRTDSRFDTEFTNASIQGAAYRAKQIANRPMAMGAAIASDLNRPTVDEDFRIQAELEKTPIEKFINHPMSSEIETATPIADDSALKEAIMQRLRNGEYSHSVMASTEGFYANKLSNWRKDANFVDEWNKAKAVGRIKRDSDVVAEHLTEANPAPIHHDMTVQIPGQPVPKSTTVTATFSEPEAEPSPNPLHDYLPEGLVRRYVILKAQDCFEFLMSEQQAIESATQHSAADNMPYYIAMVGHIALPTITSTVHALD